VVWYFIAFMEIIPSNRTQKQKTHIDTTAPPAHILIFLKQSNPA
jgi:hypothetical protein